MSMQERVYSVLLVSASQQINTAVSRLLPRDRYEPAVIVDNVSAAKRMMNERVFDFVIVNSPLPDDSGIHFLIDVSEGGGNTVGILLIKNENYPDVYGSVTRRGIFMISKPVVLTTVTSSLQWAEAVAARLKEYERRTQSLEDKMAEIRVVNRAKWLLIDKQHMTESEAHRYIEKQAMDRGVKRRVIANEIIDGTG